MNGLGSAVDVVSALLEPGLSGPVVAPIMVARRRLPHDPSEQIPGFSCTVVGGTAPWLPSKHADRPMLHMSATTAWIVPPGLPRRIDLDLQNLRATRLIADRGIAGLAGDCTATLLDREIEFQVRGPWIAIAWLGHLGRWPDPAAAT
jgi:hypothetical protein